MIKIVYFVHGTTTDNEEGRATGWNPGYLSEKGKQQSLNLRSLINIDDFDYVFSSDLKRALDSAFIALGGIGGKNITYAPKIRECNYGELNGRSCDLINYSEHIDVPFPRGECLLDVEKRVRDFLDYLLEKYDGKTIALMSHKAPQLALDVITKNISWNEAIEQDWRKTGDWQPGWVYEIEK